MCGFRGLAVGGSRGAPGSGGPCLSSKCASVVPGGTFPAAGSGQLHTQGLPLLRQLPVTLPPPSSPQGTCTWAQLVAGGVWGVASLRSGHKLKDGISACLVLPGLALGSLSGDGAR